MENIVLSKRLLAAAVMIADQSMVADIGTDHGYLPIYLIQSKKTDRVIAMDVRKGPLEKAKQNVAAYGVSDSVELRLSDGLFMLKPNEADTITICGMGGKLISAILERGKDRISSSTELILSPQSEIPQFREYLYYNGYITDMEDMICEDGKYYVIIKCHFCNQPNSEPSPCFFDPNVYINESRVLNENSGKISDSLCSDANRIVNIEKIVNTESTDDFEIFMRYGRYLLEHKNAVLKEYILKEKKTVEHLIDKVSTIATENAMERLVQLEREMTYIGKGLKYYDM